MISSFFLDSIIAILLVITIVYCWKLSRKITMLREGQINLDGFIHEFNIAISRAENNITELKELGGKADEELCEHIKKARFLANDLSFLMDKGENVADELENHINTSRAFKAHTQPANLGFSSPTLAKKKKVTAEQKKPLDKKRQTSSDMPHSKKKALDDVLEQIAARKEKANNPSIASAKQPISTAEDNIKPPSATMLSKEKQSSFFNKRRILDSLKANN